MQIIASTSRQIWMALTSVDLGDQQFNTTTSARTDGMYWSFSQVLSEKLKQLVDGASCACAQADEVKELQRGYSPKTHHDDLPVKYVM